MKRIIKTTGTAFHNYEQTGDYNALLDQLNNSIQCLYSQVLSHRNNIEQLKHNVKSAVVRTECAIGGDIHRGPYCPSPVVDIVLGNTKRGRVLKRISPTSKVTHRFGFDVNNVLLCVEQISVQKKCVFSTEYLIHSGDSVLGVTVNNAGELTMISEERYANGLLMSYCCGDIHYRNGQPQCYLYVTEEYSHDEHGLRTCKMIQYDLRLKMVEIMMRCEFQRTDGFLSSFTVDNLFSRKNENFPTLHEIRVKRSAKWHVTGDGLREPG